MSYAAENVRIPIIKLYDNLIIAVQMDLSDELVRQLREDIAAKIDRTSPRGLIIDLSGVDIMDSYITRAIHDIALVSTLMGVKTVICGFDPMIAMNLVEMGIDLKGLATELNLEAALEKLAVEEEDEERAIDLIMMAAYAGEDELNAEPDQEP